MKIIKSEVEVKIGGKAYTGPVQYREAETADDILDLLQSPDPAVVKRVLKTWNYGENLEARAIVRQRIQKHETAPEKAKDKFIKAIMDMHANMGITLTREEAEAKLDSIAPKAAEPKVEESEHISHAV